jgi:hypothetical protein
LNYKDEFKNLLKKEPEPIVPGTFTPNPYYKLWRLQLQEYFDRLKSNMNRPLKNDPNFKLYLQVKEFIKGAE